MATKTKTVHVQPSRYQLELMDSNGESLGFVNVDAKGAPIVQAKPAKNAPDRVRRATVDDEQRIAVEMHYAVKIANGAVKVTQLGAKGTIAA